MRYGSQAVQIGRKVLTCQQAVSALAVSTGIKIAGIPIS